MLVSLTVGKVDAGVAVLLTEDKRLVCAPAPPIAPCLPATLLADGHLYLPSRSS
jgi:hypothetical protein